MSMIEQIQKDIVTAMKAKEEARLSCLRMVKSALQNRQVEKMAPLDEQESQQVLSTLIKQRKESIEQFTKGGRQEMADKEAAEIKIIEGYLPKAATADEIAAGVKAVIASLRRAFSDFRLEIEDLAVDGDKVWLRMTGSGTNDGPFMGNEPTGRRMRVDVFDLIRVVDGKMVEHWGVPDRLGSLFQLGLAAA